MDLSLSRTFVTLSSSEELDVVSENHLLYWKGV